MKTLTTINYDKIGTRYTQNEEDALDAIRSKTGLGYKMSKFEQYEPIVKSSNASSMWDKLTREAKDYYSSIKGKYVPYFERNKFTDTGYKNEQHDQDLRDEEDHYRVDMINRLVAKYRIDRKTLEGLSMDRLIRLIERIGEKEINR